MEKKKTYNLTVSRRFQSYIAVGIGAFVTEYLIFVAITNATSSLLVAQTVSFLCGLVVSFLGSRYVTFKARQQDDYVLSGKSQFWRYVVLALANLLLSNALIHVLAVYFMPMVAKLMVMAAVVLWNYAIFNKVIFRSK